MQEAWRYAKGPLACPDEFFRHGRSVLGEAGRASAPLAKNRARDTTAMAIHAQSSQEGYPMKRFSLVLLGLTIGLTPLRGQTTDEKKASVAYLHSLQSESGGYLSA